MSKINLHTHSKHSLDGFLEVHDIINQCLSNGISYLSITDHNTCDAYSELELDKIHDECTLVYGMEADAIINNVTYDILCYGFDLSKVSLWAKKQYGTIASRQMKIYNKLIEMCKDLNLILDNTGSYNPKNEFAHSAVFKKLNSSNKNKNFLSKYGVSNVNDFYRLSTMDSTFPLFIDMKIVWPTIDVLSKIIHDNGGKLFLAHPYKYIKNININDLLNSCASFIDGIEICNEPKNKDEVIHLYEYAKQSNLLISAGSDFHGSKNHNNLNTNYLNEEMNTNIKNWIDKIPGKVIIQTK